MTTVMKIKYVEETVRAEWKTLDDLRKVFTDEEICEQVNRWQDAQKHARNYRVRQVERQKLMRERLSELEEKVKQTESGEKEVQS